MAVTISNAAAIAALDSITALLGTSAHIEIFELGELAPPVDCEAADVGTSLVSLQMANPAFGAATDDTPGAVASATGITPTAIVTSGTAEWARIRTAHSGGTVVVQGPVGATGASGKLVNFNTTTFTATVTAAVTALYLRLPETGS